MRPDRSRSPAMAEPSESGAPSSLPATAPDQAEVPVTDVFFPDEPAEPVPTDLAFPGRRYLVQAEVGRDGLGIVYRARDLAFDRTLAVKVLQECYRGQPDAERRFREEARLTGRLQHAGIPAAHDLGTLDDGRPYF